MHAVSLTVIVTLALSAIASVRPHEPQTTREQERLAEFLTVPKTHCFPTAHLSADEAQRSETLLLNLLDGEGLYTFVGGLKPVTSRNFFKNRFGSESPKTSPAFVQAAEDMRRLASAWSCGTVTAYVFTTWERARDSDTFLINGRAVTQMITANPAPFTVYGLTPTSHPIEVLTVLASKRPEPETSRALGYLWGYPRYAVDWYVDVRQKAPGPPGELNNVEIPTFSQWKIPVSGKLAQQYLWVVPKDHEENGDDRRIRAEAEKILTAYKERRSRYIGEGKPGAFSLMRDWYCDARERCSSQNASELR